jgi:hypothetical protein
LLADVDFDSLTNTRAFLGWWGNTTYHLGTADANYDNIDYSDTREPGRSIVFRGGRIGFQKIAAGEVNFLPGPKDSKLHISRNGPYQRIVKYTSRTPLVLYDTCEKRSWLCRHLRSLHIWPKLNILENGFILMVNVTLTVRRDRSKL